MKKVKMFISAAIIFAVVGSALAFKAKSNPNLYTCIQGTCQLAAYSDFATAQEVDNPGNLYKPITGLTCHVPSRPTDPCQIYTAAKVYINN